MKSAVSVLWGITLPKRIGSRLESNYHLGAITKGSLGWDRG